MKIYLSANINQVSVNISSLDIGVYCYKYFVNNQTIHTGKLIIE
jgi:hypothetical protein